MLTLKIDNQTVSAEEGDKILDAAAKLGVEIPTLCYRKGYDHFTSCMLCVVRDKTSGRLLPSCSAPVAAGMVIETNTAEVREARKSALDLLLSEHVGDCEAPCRQVCPAHMNIPLMIRQIIDGKLQDAIATVKEAIALPAVLGRICPAPCENGCRRGSFDLPVAICLLKRFVADADLARQLPYLPERCAMSGKKVAIVGSGPAGLTAAFHLLLKGHACTIFDEHEKPGGMLRYGVSPENLPHDVLDAEIGVISRLGAGFQLNTKIGKDFTIKQLKHHYDAIVLAIGKIDPGTGVNLGVEITDRGIKVGIETSQTSDESIFAGGDAVQPSKMAVRSVAQGKAVAYAVDQFLAGIKPGREPARFDSRVGKLLFGEISEFMKEVSDAVRVSPKGGPKAGFSNAEAVSESKRCLHCDCRKLDTCRLRLYADAYEAERRRFKSDTRKKFERLVQHADVIYEPGKCIKCGLCVQITGKQRESLGLTFIGRGFDVRVGVPFNESMDRALQQTAAECVEACPTGAIAWKRERKKR